MRIGVDFDGVITDCGQLKSEGAERIFGVSIPPRLFKKEIVVGGGHLTLEQYRYLQKEIYHGRKLGLFMKAVDGAYHHLRLLKKRGHEIIVITSREEGACDVAREWCQMQYLDLDLIGVGYGKSKAEAARGLDIYVDDDLDKLEPLVDIVPHLFLFSWGYNEHIDESGIAKRISSWRELFLSIVGLEAPRD